MPPIIPKNHLAGLRLPNYREEEDTLAEAILNGGMVTSVDSTDLKNGQFVMAKNAFVRYDKTSRRYGTEALTPAKPNSNRILHLHSWERFDGTSAIYRYTPSTIHKHSIGAWTAVTGAALNGSTLDRYQTAIINDRLFFTNNGADFIQEINGGANTYARAGNAPKYRYLIGFNNRLLAANYADSVSPSSVQVGWSGNLNFTEWDTAVDPSAGSVALVDTSTDYSDHIRGLFGFTETAILLRERSIWGIGKQPSATNPFTFFPIFPGIGCDSPFSAVSINSGIAWFDIRSGTVYAYRIGDTKPEPIGRPVEKSILSHVNDAVEIFGSYNTAHEEYTICIPSELTSVVRIWTYSFKTQAWTYGEVHNLTCLSNIDYASVQLTIDELTGFVNDLVGTIDSLGSSVEVASRFYGFSNGDVTVENNLSDLDNGTSFEMVLTSKTFNLPRYRGFIQALRIEYIPRLEGSFTISYSKDDGQTWTTYKTVTMDTADIGLRKLAVCRKHLLCSQYTWKITCSDGLVDFVGYDISIIKSMSEQENRG
jgi:hypothetical protein